MAVPTWMPSRFCAVEKALGSGLPSGGGFAGAILVAVEVVDEELVEGLEIVVAHGGVGEAVEPCVVGDEGDDALAVGVLGDATLGLRKRAKDGHQSFQGREAGFSAPTAKAPSPVEMTGLTGWGRWIFADANPPSRR